MYRIIGADQKEYGPLPAEQIRQWIAEGRLNGQTPACAEGSQEWKPLADFPEFGLGATAAGAIPGGSYEAPPATEEILTRDYNLDITGCISRSWELFKKNPWPVIGISFLVMLVAGGINQLLGLVSRPAMNDMILNKHVSAGGIAILLATNILGMPVSSVAMGGL